MARKVFFSFHYKPDGWRASQVRNMGLIEGNQPCSDNDWETVTRGGETAIKRWISEQLQGRSCCVVLVGSETAGRRWITHEIVESWNAKKGVVGIRIHGLKNHSGSTSSPGSNPFDHVTLKKDNTALSRIVKLYEPTSMFGDSALTYATIKSNLSGWVEEAVEIRGRSD